MLTGSEEAKVKTTSLMLPFINRSYKFTYKIPDQLGTSLLNITKLSFTIFGT